MDLYQWVQIGVMLVGLGIVYGKLSQKIDAGEVRHGETIQRIEKIETQLGNHITHIAADIKEIAKDMVNVRERISRIEERTER